MTRLLIPALRWAMRQGWRRGLLGGNRAWIVVGGAALVAHLAGRALPRRDETVFSEVISPGETFDVHHSSDARRA